jgi:hypothetical protein
MNGSADNQLLTNGHGLLNSDFLILFVNSGLLTPSR